MITGTNQLTPEIKGQLKQGSKVEFKWHGSDMLYIGRIEVGKFGDLFFCSEHNYEGESFKPYHEGMRFYNRLDSFFHFTHFQILTL